MNKINKLSHIKLLNKKGTVDDDNRNNKTFK